MIDPQINIVDLDPYTWKHLEEVWSYIEPPKRRMYILEENGSVIRAVRETGEPALCNHKLEITDPKFVEEGFTNNPDIEQIMVMNREGLIHYYRMAEAGRSPQLDTDHFISLTNSLLRNCEGIHIYDRTEQADRDVWTSLRRLVKTQLNSDHTLAIVLFDEAAELYFHIVLQFKEHRLFTITTLDHFPELSDKLSSLKLGDHEMIHWVIKNTFLGQVTTLVMKKAEFFEKTWNLIEKNT